MGTLIDRVQPVLVIQVCSLEVLLDPLLHLDLQVTAVTRSTSHQLAFCDLPPYPCFHNHKVRLLQCAQSGAALSDYPAAAAGAE